MTSETVTNRKVLLFTQSGCFSCELMKVFLEAKEIIFEEAISRMTRRRAAR